MTMTNKEAIKFLTTHSDRSEEEIKALVEGDKDFEIILEEEIKAVTIGGEYDPETLENTTIEFVFVDMESGIEAETLEELYEKIKA